MTNRRSFLKGIGLIATASITQETTLIISQTDKPANQHLFKLGMAGYSFVHFNLDDSLAMMKKTDVHYLCIKDFHLPYTSTAEQITAFHQKLKEADVKGYAVGPIYMKTHQEIDAAFDYAKRVGVNLIVGIPNPEDLPYVDQKVKETSIRYAIHNHGPGDKLYPNAQTIYDRIKGLDPLIGLCLDIGHTMRYGNDPIADLSTYAKRIFDIHLKNVTSANPEGTTCELGRGVINIAAFVRQLKKIKYDGCCSLEYEKDMKDPLAGIAESVGYFKGICDVVS